jgi:hypothetical protein
VAFADADNAGRQWGERLVELVGEQGAELRVVEPPEEGLDLNGWALRDDEWTSALPQPPVPAFEVGEVDVDVRPGRSVEEGMAFE